MRRRFARDSGQSTVEYALATLLVVVIIGALWSMLTQVRTSGITADAARDAPYSVSDPLGMVKDVLMH